MGCGVVRGIRCAAVWASAGALWGTPARCPAHGRDGARLATGMMDGLPMRAEECRDCTRGRGFHATGAIAPGLTSLRYSALRLSCTVADGQENEV